MKHRWVPTERTIPGAVIFFHACISCETKHLKAYNMVVHDTNQFMGTMEYEMRSQHV